MTHIYQVVSEGLEKEDVLEREIRALSEAAIAFPSAKQILIVKNPPKKKLKLPCAIVPLWQILLEDERDNNLN